MSKPVVVAAIAGAAVGFLAAKRVPDEFNIRIPYVLSISFKKKKG